MIQMGFGLQQFFDFISDFAERVDLLKDTLNDLDNRIGDGDHGTNMARGFKVANQQLLAQLPTDLGSACSTVAMALLGNVGGASGPLYGTVFLKLGGVLKNFKTVEDEVLLEGLLSAKSGIMERGKAQLGDKTMLDVWEPATVFLQTHPETGAFQQVVSIVREAALDTRDKVAKKGRAAYLGARSAGTCDPGSVSSGLFFEVLANVHEGGVEAVPWATLVL